MGKHVSEVEVLRRPVNGDASDSTFTDSVFDDLLTIASIRSNSEDSVVLVLLVVHPVDPVAFNVVVQMKDVVTWKKDFFETSRKPSDYPS